MDYSKKGVEHKQQYIKSSTRRFVSKTRLIIFRVCISFILLTAIVGSITVYGLMKGLIDGAPDISQIDAMSIAEASTIYDKDSNPIKKLVSAGSNREIVNIKDIPKHLQDAFIAIEDERFREHNGIDIRGILRASFRGLTSGDFDQGASTLTQQLIKNQLFNGGMETSFSAKVKRKIQEQYLAIQLETKLDKDTILQDYLNTINLGAGSYGIQTASKRYFGKPVKKLTLSECAVIAGITKSPVYLNPIKYPKVNAKRREEVLMEMLEQKLCTQQEYDEAMADKDVYNRIQTVDSSYKETEDTTYSYFIDALIDQVGKDLEKKLGCDQSQAQRLLYSGGLKIYTTQDMNIQKICDKAYMDDTNFPQIGNKNGAYYYLDSEFAVSVQRGDDEDRQTHYHLKDLLEYFKDYKDPNDLYVDRNGSKFSQLCYSKKDMLKRIEEFKKAMMKPGDSIIAEKVDITLQPQSSITILDQKNGHVVALVGGRGQKHGMREFSRATDSPRQPGSTFKILAAYVPALDQVGLTLGSVKDDSAPYKYPDSDRLVSNHNSNKGLVTLREGIRESMNIVTVKTFADVTPQVGFDYLKNKFHFSTVFDTYKQNNKTFSDIQYPTCLGGITKGVTNLELTAAYAAIANNGFYNKPVFYTKIVDHEGNILINNKPKPEAIMKESTAWLITNAMEDVVNYGTGTACKLPSGMPAAGKTGTTTNNVDLWFSGYTPYYTASIWFGIDNNQPQDSQQSTFHKKLWSKIMDGINKKLDLERKSFTMPDSIVACKICSKSGKLAVDGVCDSSLDPNDKVYTEYFAEGTEPTEYCDVHRKVSICTESNKLAIDGCPQDKVKTAVYLIKEENARTADTPYILPTEECTLHSGGFLDNIGNMFPGNNGNENNGENNTDEQGQGNIPPDDGTNTDPNNSTDPTDPTDTTDTTGDTETTVNDFIDENNVNNNQ